MICSGVKIPLQIWPFYLLLRMKIIRSEYHGTEHRYKCECMKDGGCRYLWER
jgi:hypothetical protein